MASYNVYLATTSAGASKSQIETGVAAGTNVLLTPADMQESTFTKVHS